MSLLTRVFSLSAWSQSAEISVLISGPTAYDEVGFLSQIFDKVLISSDRDWVRLQSGLHTWRENVTVYEHFPCCPAEVNRPLSDTSQALWFELKAFRVFAVFDSGSFSFTHSETGNWRTTLEQATRIFIGRIKTNSEVRIPANVLELSVLLDGASPRSGILARKLVGVTPFGGGRRSFTIVEYNDSVRKSLAAAARSAIENSLIEARSGLEPY